jgi:ArsR family transcriptional regulator, arsenate/arsenite/antimonite-responsive transcriptional repressor
LLVLQFGQMAETLVVPCCPPILEGELSAEDADELATTLKALADPARLRLLSVIQAQPEGEACVCHLTEPLGLGQPTISHHLRILEEAGFLKHERRGRWVYYRVVPEALTAVQPVFSWPGAQPRRASRG